MKKKIIYGLATLLLLVALVSATLTTNNDWLTKRALEENKTEEEIVQEYTDEDEFQNLESKLSELTFLCHKDKYTMQRCIDKLSGDCK